MSTCHQCGATTTMDAGPDYICPHHIADSEWCVANRIFNDWLYRNIEPPRAEPPVVVLAADGVEYVSPPLTYDYGCD